MFDKEKIELELIKEMYSMPGQNFIVKIKYSDKKELKEFQYIQFDSPPYFPRINRFYEFCISRMPQFKFIDYEAIECLNPPIRYLENIEKEFTIH